MKNIEMIGRMLKATRDLTPEEFNQVLDVVNAENEMGLKLLPRAEDFLVKMVYSLMTGEEVNPGDVYGCLMEALASCEAPDGTYTGTTF